MPGENMNELKESAAAYQATVSFPALFDDQRPVRRIAERLEPFLRLLVERIHPVRIILFGSYAYGQPSEHSDVDLLVIRRDITDERASNLEIRRLFHEVAADRPPFTILSKTPERIANRIAVKSPLYEEILGKGIELYAA
jgi:predicted nucleotidyltransferase